MSTATRKIPAAKGGTVGEKCCLVILPKWRFPRHLGIFYMPQIYDGIDGFTSPPKEGVLRIFFLPLKIRRRWPDLNPRTWVLKASTLPLDHRRHTYIHNYTHTHTHTHEWIHKCVTQTIICGTNHKYTNIHSVCCVKYYILSSLCIKNSSTE